MNRAAKQDAIRAYYRTLIRAWGHQHWWPARTRFEVIIGAYLTQNTAWTNVELALRNLRAAGILSLKGIRNVPQAELESLVRPSGYFRQKAGRLKTFVAFLDQRYRGSLARMFAQPPEKLRQELLALNGVGPETADSILLYAGRHSVFVVDAYTRRILHRHGILPEDIAYEDVRKLVERALATLAEEDCAPTDPPSAQPEDNLAGAAHPPSPMSLATRSPLAQRYGEMHALMVGVGKNYCVKSNPRCEHCPLRLFLPRALNNSLPNPGGTA